MEAYPRLLIFVSTGSANVERRRSLRRSWFQYCRAPESPLPAAARSCVEVVFVASRGDAALAAEAEEEGDIVLVDAPEGYENLWRKALVFLQGLVQQARGSGPNALQYVMHADDDSFVRLDLLLPYLARCPRQRFYWGYIWDGTGNRVTAPIRNERNKSHMPSSQYPLDYYPPFASGCGFVLSWDLVAVLTKQPLPDYRLLDPPFGIHLCGPASDGYLVLEAPVVPVHEERVRPYRPIPMFHPHTLVQHYMHAEEMKPYYKQALEAAAAAATGGTCVTPVLATGTTSTAAAAADGTGDAPTPASSTATTAAVCSGKAQGAVQQGPGQGATERLSPASAGSTGLTPGANGMQPVEPGSGDRNGAAEAALAPGCQPPPGAPEQLYATLVSLGLLRR